MGKLRKEAGMTIGEVLDAIKHAKDDAIVRFDFGGVSPTKVDSWRGVYAEAAIGFTDGEYGAPYATVKMFREELEAAIGGRTHSGWKGGDYSYSRRTPLHVDNRGNCSNTEIERVEVEEYQVILHTTYERSY
jgi:hypothetical protein